VAFCAEDERALLRDIEKVTRQKIPSVDRRNDPELAQLSVNANIEAKRGARAEPRGEPQPHRQQQKRQRMPEHARGEHRGEQRHRAEAPERAPQQEQRGEGQGRSRRRRGKGGSPGWSGVAKQDSRQTSQGHKPYGDKRRGQKSANHRKGQKQPQQAARGDVMKVAAGPSGPVTPADALMKHLSSTWNRG
jgi:ATP-dependent RNA helicase RhlE